MKRVLVVEFSQTGQLTAVLDALLAPLLEPGSGVTVHRERLRPEPAYPFPWPFWRFLDQFPETVAQEPVALAPLSVPAAEYDLVILGYPIWYLSPPPPLVAFLRGEDGRRLLHGRPVVTVTACRNMWLMAQEDVKELLRTAGARHCDHVALVDPGSALATFVTTPRWMWTGRKNSFLGFPPAGVSAEQIRNCARFGLALRAALAAGEETRDSPLLRGLRACNVDPRLIASERVGKRSFRIWSRLLRASGRPGTPLRRALLACYLLFLLTMIVTVVPLTMLVKAILRPLLQRKLAALQAFHEQPSGGGDERLAAFSPR
ncbi:MAG TPA: dialkylresorcinol condensing enzyme [Opitutaceae bacterium]|nr:dialkylresorcinol condensing enzyme [Opitutaceae bacterium]